MNNFGFIVLRHVNNKLTNRYWLKCVESIRKYYPDVLIVIIDDNSNYDYVSNVNFANVRVLNSKFKKRGELLPYYYYSQYNFFDNAVIIHDSVFVNKYIDFSVNNYKLLWEFEHNWDQIDDETKMIDIFEDIELKSFYENKSLWKGCFGCMTIINHDFLVKVNEKYNFGKLIDLITTRYNRCSFERVLACLLQKEAKKETLLGNIHKYCPWGIQYHNRYRFKKLPLIKVWTGR